MPDEHAWMLFGAVVRDAVTAYEVYLGKALDAALRHHGVARNQPEQTPHWNELKASYRLLGTDPRPPAVDEVIELRNLLTHRRGALRTPEHRALFAKDHALLGPAVAHLDKDRVGGYLDALAANVKVVDPVIWAYTYRSHPVPAWDNLTP